MADKHLNLFYSYHIEQSSLLCEDNLTRAFIQTLRCVSPEMRGRLLHKLFDDCDEHLRGCDFTHAAFALQGHMVEPAPEFEFKRIVTMSTRVPEREEGGPVQEPSGGSRPDAWIYDGDGRAYCLLIECKRGGNEIDPDQLRRHAWEHFRMQPQDLEKRRSDLTWLDVLKGVEEEQQHAREDGQHEREYVLSSLIGFLDQFGYRLFRGFDLDKMPGISDFTLCSADTERNWQAGFDFAELAVEPAFRLVNKGE